MTTFELEKQEKELVELLKDFRSATLKLAFKVDEIIYRVQVVKAMLKEKGM